jgi:hypothetical protein
MDAGSEIGPTDPTGRGSGRDHRSFNGLAWLGSRRMQDHFRSLPPKVRATVDTRGKQHDRLLLATPVLPVAGEHLHSRESKLSSFMHKPRTGNCRRKLTASSGASGFAISGRRLPLFRRLVNSRKLKAIIRISASAGAMRRSLCRPRRSRDCMRTTSSWPPRLTAYLPTPW